MSTWTWKLRAEIVRELKPVSASTASLLYTQYFDDIFAEAA
jgi:hypothetical protein